VELESELEPKPELGPGLLKNLSQFLKFSRIEIGVLLREKSFLGEKKNYNSGM
jgi:hypothetical protein